MASGTAIDFQECLSARLRATRNPALIALSLDTLTLFICIALRLLPEHEKDNPPFLLLPAQSDFLSLSTGLTTDLVQQLWSCTCDLLPQLNIPTVFEEDDMFRRFAAQTGIGAVDLRPQHTFCVSDTCKGMEHPLSEERSTRGRLYTMTRGILPVNAINTYCRVCLTRYHHNFRVEQHVYNTNSALDKEGSEPSTTQSDHGHRRVYEDFGASDIYQINRTRWVHREFLEYIQWQMAFAHSSAENISKIYNAVFAHPTGRFIDGSNLKDAMDPRLVYDTLFMLGCWRYMNSRDVPFITPHEDHLHERLQPLISLRNLMMRGIGQDMWPHRCEDCMKIRAQANGGICYTSAAITDGVTIGYPCCSIEGDCRIPLRNSKHQYCQQHAYKKNECFIRDCTSPRLPKRMACRNEEHLAQEAQLPQNTEKSIRENAHRFQRAAGLDSSTSTVGQNEMSSSTPVFPKGKGRPKRRFKRLSRKMTHNDQLVVYACGTIAARMTMHHSEGLREVKDFLKSVFPAEYPGALPTFIFYDNNCNLLEHLVVQGDHHFDRCGLSVDAFHFGNKHKEKDNFCAIYCNPAKFPELLSEEGDKYLFNSSAAEQVNRWYGRFQPITREMSADRYNFFMDEMVSVRNRWHVQELHRKGRHPFTLPPAVLRDL